MRRPNRLAVSSAMMRALFPRSSRTGLSSTTSSPVTRARSHTIPITRGATRDVAPRVTLRALLAAQENRNRFALHRPIGGILDGPYPAGNLGGVARCAFEPDRWTGDRHDIAAIGDLVAKGGKRRFQFGDPQRLRTHGTAAPAGA